MNLGDAFDEVSKIMRARLNHARKSIDVHPGYKGTAFENILIEFLKEYLPTSIDVFTGFAIDTSGNQSKQLDIILTDRNKTPKFYQSGEARIVPIECVYGVIEVKADFQTSDITEITENMLSVRKLEKKSYVRPTDNPLNQVGRAHFIYGRQWEIWPVHYFVFAFDSVGLDTLLSGLNSSVQARSLPPWTRIDSVCVLDKGMICNKYPDGIDALPGPNSVYHPIQTPRALLLFYTLICTHLFQAELPSLKLNPYAERFII